MANTLRLSPSSIRSLPNISPNDSQLNRNTRFIPKVGQLNHLNDAVLQYPSSKTRGSVCCGVGNVQRLSSLESLFCYDKSVPEQIIEKPIGVSLEEKNVGGNPRCSSCQAKGAILCPTCTGSGLYVDSIMESQGIIVKVRCLGCGGSGNTMCSECGGRGHM